MAAVPVVGTACLSWAQTLGQPLKGGGAREQPGRSWRVPKRQQGHGAPGGLGGVGVREEDALGDQLAQLLAGLV